MGDVKDAQEVVTGVDLITGESLTPGERVITVVAAVVPVVGGKALREAAAAVGATNKVPNPGGRLGKQETREHVAEVADALKGRGYDITAGGGVDKEEYLRGAGPGTKGSAFVDITAVKDGRDRENELRFLINVGSHEAGHASGALGPYNFDGAPPGSSVHPEPAVEGSIMEHGVKSEVLGERLREFSRKDAALLRKHLNEN